MNVIKRNGSEVLFEPNKISEAISKANKEMEGKDKLAEDVILQIQNSITSKCEGMNRSVSVEDIQDMVERALYEHKMYKLMKSYMIYRYQRSLLRKKNTTDDTILSLLDDSNEEIKQENSNKNSTIISVQRDYMAGEVSKDLCRRVLFPDTINKAHDEGLIHQHDRDYIAAREHNCDLIDLKDMLENGTCISGTYIETPKSFSTACNVATQVIAQVASSQYGGCTFSLAHLVPFIDVSRQKIKADVVEEVTLIIEASGTDKTFDEFKDLIDTITEKRLMKEIKNGIQTIQYQLVTLQTTNGQAPFVSMALYLNEIPETEERQRKDFLIAVEEVLKQRTAGIKNEQGVPVTIAFPKLLYFLQEDNYKPGTKYWYLTQLAARCNVKRLVPDYISEKKMLEYKIDKNGNGNAYPCMGCRSFLTPYIDPETGKPKYYGRFNVGVVTINLPDVALSAIKELSADWPESKDIDHPVDIHAIIDKLDFEDIKNKFFEILDTRLELCHSALQLRHKRLRGTKSDVAPILWQHGALARLKKGETIDKLLFNGYSTISLGYCGLYETVYAMTGKSHTDESVKDFAKSIMQALNDACNKWKEAEHIDYSLYGTPLESVTYKFAKTLQTRFGFIENVTNHNYLTNSYHVVVREEIDAFTKLKFESEFQKLSPGGAISYIEVPDMANNIQALEQVISYIYDNIMYAEINTKSDYCQKCGFTGEIQIKSDKNKKLFWQCPNCGNTDQNTMNVARRTCGLTNR